MQQVSANMTSIMESIYSNTMKFHDLPTDRSIEVEDQANPTHLSHHSLVGSPQLLAGKIARHLQFMEAEFMHNMEWQKKLLNHILMQEQSLGKYKSPAFKEESQKTNTLNLNTNQQHILKEILGAVIGQQDPELSIKELIKQAGATLKQKKQCSQKYTIFSSKEEVAQSLESAACRLINENEFTTSRQVLNRLPPRSPKQKSGSSHRILQKEQSLHTPNQYSLKLWNEEVNLKYEDHLRKNLKDTDCLQDSLGRRLFQDAHNPLIHINDISDEENLPHSQVSLSLSQSNWDKKKYEDTPISPLAYQSPSANERHLQTLHFQVFEVTEKGSSAEQMFTHQKENNLNIGQLCFADIPRRRIGKAVTRNQKKLDYGKSCEGRVKKLRDSFGKTYQEYPHKSSLVENEEEFYQSKSTLMQKSEESKGDWYRIE